MTDSKIRKKLFAEVTASIWFETASDRAEQLVEHFLARRGIELLNNVTYDTQKKRRTVVSFNVRYKVHGGWRSDFVRKLEIDAADLGVELRNLTVEVVRREIPAECPRKECAPCAIALNPALAQVQTAIKHAHTEVTRRVEEAKPDTLPTRRKLFKILGGNS